MIDWEKKARQMFVGRKVVMAGYISREEADEVGWSSRSVYLIFDDGLEITVSTDDEGNDAGALFTTDDKVPILPVIP